MIQWLAQMIFGETKNMWNAYSLDEWPWDGILAYILAFNLLQWMKRNQQNFPYFFVKCCLWLYSKDNFPCSRWRKLCQNDDITVSLNISFTSINNEVTLSHYCDIKMSAMATQITGVSVVCSTVCPVTDQRKQQSSAPLAFVRGIRWWPVVFPTQNASNAENVSIWWRHHYLVSMLLCDVTNNWLEIHLHNVWEYLTMQIVGLSCTKFNRKW